jgi:cell division septation protein DedD
MMRRVVLALVIVATLLAGLAVWRSPTAALVSLKLALDRRDLSAVAAALDYHAITDAALAQLVEGRPEEPVDIRLVLRGENAWIPAVSSARAYLRVRLEREVERLVEEPEHALDVSWEDVRRALATLRRSGSVARFRVPGRRGEEYVIRMRQGGGRWRIVAVDRDGEPVLLGPAPPEPQPASAESADEQPNEPEIEAQVADADVDGTLAPMVAEYPSEHLQPPPRPRGKRSPFVRRRADGTWTVQVIATVDAVEADLEREWFDSIGEPAFVDEADVRGTTWQRVQVGRYATRAEAADTLARLADASAAEASARR